MPKKSPNFARKPRCPQPFFRTQTQSWYVQLQGNQIPLGRDREEAWDKYNELMAASGQSNPTVRTIQLDDELVRLPLASNQKQEADRSAI